MPTMSTINHDIHFSLFKGDPGTRKSTAALSYPKPIYFFSYDRKMNALTIPMQKWNINPDEVHYDDYEDWTKAASKLEEFRIKCPYKTIVIDSITTCADAMLRQTLKLKTGNRASGAAAGKLIGGIAVNEIEDFNAEAGGLNELMALTKDIQKFHKIDVILIAHIINRDSKKLDGKVEVSRTIVTAGKAPAAKIPAICDETYHFGIERAVIEGQGGAYIIQTTNTGSDYARSSLPLPTVIQINDDPLYEKYILPAINKLKAGPVQSIIK